MRKHVYVISEAYASKTRIQFPFRCFDLTCIFICKTNNVKELHVAVCSLLFLKILNFSEISIITFEYIYIYFHV